jgi:hypothetical protein
MGEYADYDTAPAMKFMDSRVTVGHTFTLHPPYIPAGQAVLTAKVVAVGTGNVPGAPGPRGIVQVAYLLDYGVDVYAFSGGHPYSWVRMFDFGRITYAEGIGPIADEERIGGFAGLSPVRSSYVIRLAWQPTAAPGSAVAVRPVAAPERARSAAGLARPVRMPAGRE